MERVKEGFKISKAQTPIIEEGEDRHNIYDMPGSPFVDAAMLTIGSRGNLEEMAAMQNRHSTTSGRIVKYGQEGNRAVVSWERNGEVQTIGIDDINKLAGYNDGTKRIFVYTLAKMKEQWANIPRTGYISFPLRDLVDVGMYKDTHTARRGFISATDVLMTMKMYGTARKSKKQAEAQSIDDSVVFIRRKIDKGVCYVFVNPYVNLRILAVFYTKLPELYFSLPSKLAADLFLNIFRLARQREKDLLEKGFFTISNRNIQLWLGLPDEDKVKDPFGSIKKKIEKAIEDIEAGLVKKNEAGYLKLTPVYKERTTIKEYLDNGYLKVELTDQYAYYFLKGAEDTAKSIEARKKKQEKIEIAAKAKSLSNKIDASKK